jgi:hydrogenase maturation protease
MRTIIIGIGNVHRGDDAVGVRIARRLAASHPGIGVIIEASGEGASLIDSWQGYERVILIDAVAPGAAVGPPGHVHRIDVRDRELPSAFFHYSTHAFSVAEAVEMARVLGLLPPSMIVYGVVGVSFAAGAGLSRQVEEAAELLIEELARELHPLAT